jgi:putative nucleotidyltransferase with HDIG domain
VLVVVAQPNDPVSPLTREVLRTLADLIGDALRNVQLHEHTLFGAITALSAALDAKSHVAHGHSQRVSVVATAIARELGLTERFRTNMRLAALLHDVGKIGVADRVLESDQPLGNEEVEMLRAHSEIGAEILHQIPHLDGVADAIRHHHERFDGTGYPGGLAGEEIPLGARILALADAADAIIFGRAYAPIRSEEDCLEELLASSGSQFDPDMVAAAIRVHGKTGRLIGRPGLFSTGTNGVTQLHAEEELPTEEAPQTARAEAAESWAAKLREQSARRTG